MIGMLFSRASAKAVASRTLRSRSNASCERDAVVTLGLRVLLRIGAVDAVDIGGLEDRVAFHLGGAQHRGGVGGEVGIAGAAGEHNDAVFLEMAERLAALVGFADLRHVERRHGAGRRAEPLDRGLEHQAVHHRRQHAHGVGGRPRQALARHLDAAKDVAAADHDAELDARGAGGDQVRGDAVDGRLVDAEALGRPTAPRRRP